MLYFSKLRITLVSLVSIFFIFIAASNFQNPEDSFISKKINLGLDLQGGSYLLLEIDNEPVEIQKLQNTTTVIRNFLKDKKITFNDLRIEDKKIIFSIPNDNIELVQSFLGPHEVPLFLILHWTRVLEIYCNGTDLPIELFDSTNVRDHLRIKVRPRERNIGKCVMRAYLCVPRGPFVIKPLFRQTSLEAEWENGDDKYSFLG